MTQPYPKVMNQKNDEQKGEQWQWQGMKVNETFKDTRQSKAISVI